MKAYLELLTEELKANANTEIALQQKAYLKDKFEFFGLKTPVRRSVLKPFLQKSALPSQKDAYQLVKALWQKPQREFHYFAQELAFKYVKNFQLEDIQLFEWMVANQSWWDTVDFIAVKLMGAYFKKFPEMRYEYCRKWLQSENMWLQRSALLFQLKYKSEVDTELMTTNIEALLGSKEFFINKAIGWILREYSRTNPQWVKTFVQTHELAHLSRKEALRLLNP
ncbi:MAG: DNA alkylation repair protein [Putridiphycobacter sp.]